MYLVDMHFTHIEKITPELTHAHRSYLEKAYQSGNLLFGGRKEPRTGGILLSRHNSLAALQQLLDSDPFIQKGVATYSVTEFSPVMASPEYSSLLS